MNFPISIKAVVIDLDGTLLHTAPDLAAAAQRMAADLRLPPIDEATVKTYMLILDEATSSVDTETELLIQEALQVLLKNRTAIIVAHRLSAVRHANSILVMDHGQIVVAGTHTELLEHEAGHYSRLHRLQHA